MRWYHIFLLPQYVSGLETQRDHDRKAQIVVNKTILDRVEDLEKQIALVQDMLKQMEKVLQTTPMKNDIEEEDEGWDEVDENYRIPIVPGIKIAEEGQDINNATPLNIYGFGETGVQPVKQHGSRQRKPKTN